MVEENVQTAVINFNAEDCSELPESSCADVVDSSSVGMMLNESADAVESADTLAPQVKGQGDVKKDHCSFIRAKMAYVMQCNGNQF